MYNLNFLNKLFLTGAIALPMFFIGVGEVKALTMFSSGDCGGGTTYTANSNKYAYSSGEMVTVNLSASQSGSDCGSREETVGFNIYWPNQPVPSHQGYVSGTLPAWGTVYLTDYFTVTGSGDSSIVVVGQTVTAGHGVSSWFGITVPCTEPNGPYGNAWCQARGYNYSTNTCLGYCANCAAGTTWNGSSCVAPTVNLYFSHLDEVKSSLKNIFTRY